MYTLCSVCDCLLTVILWLNTKWWHHHSTNKLKSNLHSRIPLVLSGTNYHSGTIPQQEAQISFLALPKQTGSCMKTRMGTPWVEVLVSVASNISFFPNSECQFQVVSFICLAVGDVVHYTRPSARSHVLGPELDTFQPLPASVEWDLTFGWLAPQRLSSPVCAAEGWMDIDDSVEHCTLYRTQGGAAPW